MDISNTDIPAVIRRRASQPAPRPLAQILNPLWHYTSAAETDVLRTFKRLGWIPPTEIKRLAEERLVTTRLTPLTQPAVKEPDV